MLFERVADNRRHKNRPSQGGRFDRARLGRRLEVARAMAGLGQKDIGSRVWPSQDAESARQTWSKRCGNSGTAFSLAELETAVDVLADALGRHPKYPALHGTELRGFPFITMRQSRLLETGRSFSELPDIASERDK